MPKKVEIPFKERTKPLADYNDVTLKNKTDKKLSPCPASPTTPERSRPDLHLTICFTRARHLRAQNARLLDENNVLLFSDCIRLFSYRPCNNFFLATLKTVLSCDVTEQE